MLELLKYCTTERQREYIRKTDECGSCKAAAKALGISPRTVQIAVKTIKDKAARQGHAPEHDMTKTVPDGFHLKGTSTLYDKDGNQKLQWVKTNIDRDRQMEMFVAVLEHMTEDVPAKPVVQEPTRALSHDLVNLYTFSDYHLGMLAWNKEGGRDWDIRLATQLLKVAFNDMVSRSPASDTCVINELGDFEHYDSLKPVTPAHGHVLDSDTRPEKMISATIECMDHMIETALEHHQTVHVVIAQGNHNEYSAIWRRKMYERLYRDNPRVQFVSNQVPYYAMTFGKVMLGFHHGHKRKPAQLPELFMNEFRQMYGNTEYSYLHTGHFHHQERKEIGNTVVEMHRTLAARDSHASYGGWHSRAATDVITYHREYGEFGRITIYPEFYESSLGNQ